MKISTKGRYGLRILMDLALHDDGQPRLIHEIAESQNISEKYISRLIIPLRTHGFVRSIRGAKGGFRLAMAPADITLLAVVEATEGPLSIVSCVGRPSSCPRRARCAARAAWGRLNDDIRRSMAKVTLAQLL
jgi:Rrf2 family cysteine metabolism transcriptional repressor